MSLREVIKNEVIKAAKAMDYKTDNFDDFREQLGYNVQANNIWTDDVKEKLAGFNVVEMCVELVEDTGWTPENICEMFVGYVDVFGEEYIEEAFEAQL